MGDWNQCIVIGLNNSAIDPDVIGDPDWPEYWDACLEAASALSPSQWTVEAYEAQEHNCFAFVLAFLRSLKQNPLSMHPITKWTSVPTMSYPRPYRPASISASSEKSKPTIPEYMLQKGNKKIKKKKKNFFYNTQKKKKKKKKKK